MTDDKERQVQKVITTFCSNNNRYIIHTVPGTIAMKECFSRRHES